MLPLQCYSVRDGSLPAKNGILARLTISRPGVQRSLWATLLILLPHWRRESVTATQPFSFDGSYYEVTQSLGNTTKRSAGSEESDDLALFDAVKEFGKGFARSKTGW